MCPLKKFECEHEELYQKFKKRILSEIEIVGEDEHGTNLYAELRDKMPEEKKPWVPAVGEKYWRADLSGDVFSDIARSDYIDWPFRDNHFKTREQAEEAARAANLLLKQKRREFGLE